MIIEIRNEHHVYSIQFVQAHPYRNYPGFGKSFPKTTQCIVKRDSIQIGIGEAVKHAQDPDSLEYACRISMKKAFAKAFKDPIWKYLRTEFYLRVEEELATTKADRDEVLRIKATDWWKVQGQFQIYYAKKVIFKIHPKHKLTQEKLLLESLTEKDIIKIYQLRNS